MELVGALISTVKAVLLVVFGYVAYLSITNANVGGDEWRHRPFWVAFVHKHRLIPLEDLPLAQFLHGDEDEVVLGGIEAFVSSLNEEAGLTRFGKIIAGEFLKDRMDQRRCVAKRLKEKVQALAQKQGCEDPTSTDCQDTALKAHYAQMPPPVIVLGLPRTSTTFMHALFAQDEVNFRAPKFHEYQQACPDPADPDNPKKIFDRARVELESLKLNMFRTLFFPNMSLVHHMDARAPDEDVIPLSHTGVSVIYSTTFLVPMYLEWLQTNSAKKFKYSVSYLHRFLDVHMRRTNNHRWLLKTPWHLALVGELVDEFPQGTTIIWTHRDIVKQMSSLLTLSLRMYGITSDKVSFKEFREHMGPIICDFWLWALERGVTDRIKIESNGAKVNFIDVSFENVKKDAFSIAQRIYQRIGIQPSEDALAKIKRFAETSSSTHITALPNLPLKAFGINEQELRQRYDAIVSRLNLNFV